MKNKIVIFFLTFFYIFGPVFRPIGNWADLIFITSIFLCLYGFILKRYKLKKIGLIFSILFLVMAYELFLIGTNTRTTTTNFIQTFLRPIRILVTFFGGYVLVRIIFETFKGKEVMKYSLLLVFTSIFLHSLIMIFQLYNANFKDFIYLYTANISSIYDYGYNFRMGGLSGGSGGAVLSVVQSLGLVILPFLIKFFKKRKKIILLLMSLAIFYSVLISGRSGIWCFIVFTPLAFYFNSDKKNIIIFLKYSFYFVLFIFLIITSLSLFSYLEEGSDSFYAIRRSLDTFLNYSKTGDFNDDTVNILTKHLILPDTYQELVFGNGEHIVNNQSGRTLHSDIGFIRNLWSYGVVFSFLYWSPLFKLIFTNKNAKLFIILSSIMILFHFKESFLYVRMFLSILSIILFAETYNYNNSKIK